MALEVCNTRAIGGVRPPRLTEIGALPPLVRAGHLTVGVIDTGIVLDVQGRPPAWFGEGHLSYCPEEDVDELVYPREHALPSEGHGTFVAGLVLREAPSARVRMWGVLAKARMPTSEDETTDQDDRAVAAALAALALNPNVQVVNLSFGGSVWESTPTLLEGAVKEFRKDRPDVSIVASAGNTDGESAMTYPASFEGVLAVGAVDDTMLVVDGLPEIADFSNRGKWVDAYARGVDVLGPLPRPDGSQWGRWSGTSFASAVVAGRIAEVAIERRLSGADAQTVVLAESQKFEGARWVRGVDSQVRHVPAPTPVPKSLLGEEGQD